LNVKTNFTPPADFVLPLRELVKEGKVSMQTLDDRVRDVLRVKFILGLFDRPYVEEPRAQKIVNSPANQEVRCAPRAKASCCLRTMATLAAQQECSLNCGNRSKCGR
jgi:beta-glucosidase